jgi:hypothetical protein
MDKIIPIHKHGLHPCSDSALAITYMARYFCIYFWVYFLFFDLLFDCRDDELPSVAIAENTNV